MKYLSQLEQPALLLASNSQSLCSPPSLQPEVAGVLSLAINRSILEAHTGVAEQSERYNSQSDDHLL